MNKFLKVLRAIIISVAFLSAVSIFLAEFGIDYFVSLAKRLLPWAVAAYAAVDMLCVSFEKKKWNEIAFDLLIILAFAALYLI